MSGTGKDLIAGYLAELRAGLWAPAAEAELIVAEAEDHLRETAMMGMAIGMTELEAQQAAISSFGSVRAVVQAHHRRMVTAGAVVMAAWKLIGLSAAIVGAGALVAVFLLHSPPALGPGVRVVPAGTAGCQCSAPSPTTGPINGPIVASVNSGLVVALPYLLMAAGGLALLAAHRLARRRTPGRDLLSPAVTSSFFLLVTALLLALNASGAGAVTLQEANWLSPVSSGSVTTTVPLVPDAIIAACLAGAVGYGLQAALRLAGRKPGSAAPALLGRDLVSPAVTASFFLLVTALLFALNVSGVGAITSNRTWNAIPISSSGSTTTSLPIVPGAIVAACLAVAVGFGVQAAVRLARRGPGSAALALPRSG